MRILNGPETQAEGASQRALLDRDEWDLVWALREVPAGGLKDATVRLLREIVAFVGHPSCAQSQADGVPCTSVSSECAECRKVDALLGMLHDSLRG